MQVLLRVAATYLTDFRESLHFFFTTMAIIPIHSTKHITTAMTAPTTVTTEGGVEVDDDEEVPVIMVESFTDITAN